MLNKEIMHLVKDSKKNIFCLVVLNTCSLIYAVILAYLSAVILREFLRADDVKQAIFSSTRYFLFAVIAVILRFVFIFLGYKYAHRSSASVKKELRKYFFQAIYTLGFQSVRLQSLSSLTQLAVEAIEQLEVYFAQFLPQLFYSIISLIILFIVISIYSFKTAVILLICVPLIPLAIVASMKIAKKLLGKYWKMYSSLADHFIDNMNGLLSLKIYGADEWKHRRMNEDAVLFRKTTMKVLSMQLNSIIIMDLVAYGGSAVAIITALYEYMQGQIEVHICLFIILISAEFFLPLRALGSFFHVAMTGIAAAKNLVSLFSAAQDKGGDNNVSIQKSEYNVAVDFSDKIYALSCKNLSFSYAQSFALENKNDLGELDLKTDNCKYNLNNVSFCFDGPGIYGIAGKSGSGKSTLAKLIMSMYPLYEGHIYFNNRDLSEFTLKSLYNSVLYLESKTFLIKGSIREILSMAKPSVTDEEALSLLDSLQLTDFLQKNNGLDSLVLDSASNLSGGQVQRLALAQALLADKDLYIFDEFSSNIDKETEAIILSKLKILAEEKIVIFISHRLINLKDAKNILVFDDGCLVEEGNFQTLLGLDGVFKAMWNEQEKLENFLINKN